MKNKNVVIGIFAVLILVFSTLVEPPPARCSEQNTGVHGELIMSSPSGFTVFKGTMPLTFSVYWSTTEPIPWMNVDLGYSIDDNSQVWAVNGTNNLVFLSSSDILPTFWDTTVDVSNLTSGRHTLTVFANGNYNLGDLFIEPLNYTFSPVQFYVNRLPAPDIFIQFPQSKIYHTADPPLNFTTDLPTSWVGYSLDNERNITLSGNTTLTGLIDGVHSLTVYANNTEGAMGVSRAVSFTIATPPTITLVSPANRTYSQTNVPLDFTVDKAVSWAGYSLDGKLNVTATGETTLTNLASGTHNITVYANDTFGNSVSSQTVTFTVEKSGFRWSETALLAVSAAVVVVVCLSILLSYRLRKRRAV